MSAVPATPASEALPLFGQPRGLTVLFLTQMWETFSYYGMRVLLMYYMTKHLLFAQPQASMVYGVYTAMVFFTPILGGVISDRWLGRRRAVLLGGSLMALGHFVLASETLFFPALALIALGNGLFLPSLPSQIDGLYAPDDTRRFSAYNVYYLGINLGGLLAMLVCGWLGETYGWHVGFSAAGVGMLAGLTIYIAGQRYLPDAKPIARDDVDIVATPVRESWATKLKVLFGIGLCVVLFRAAYEQVGNTLALWADSGVDRHADGFLIPASWFQSLNPFFVILLTPLLLAWWARREKCGVAPRPARRMAMGAIGVALAYALLAAVAAGSTGGAHWGWLALFFLLLTISELFILPVGLGLFARLAPGRHRATTVASWFFAAFGGNLLAGALGMAWTPLGPAAFFALVAGIAALSGLLLNLLDPAVEGLSRNEEFHS